MSADVDGEAADPEQPVERVADAQRLELPGLLEQPLHGAREAQDRDQEEEEPDEAEARARARRRREDVLDRLGAAAGEVVAVDDALGGALAAEVRARRRWRWIASGISAVSALEASAIARSKPAIFWKRLTTRSTKAGRSQNVSVRRTRSRSDAARFASRLGPAAEHVTRGGSVV